MIQPQSKFLASCFSEGTVGSPYWSGGLPLCAARLQLRCLLFTPEQVFVSDISGWFQNDFLYLTDVYQIHKVQLETGSWFISLKDIELTDRWRTCCCWRKWLGPIINRLGGITSLCNTQGQRERRLETRIRTRTRGDILTWNWGKDATSQKTTDRSMDRSWMILGQN